MKEAVERLREKAQNEKTVIGLSELLRLAKEENKELRAKLERGAGECSACAYYRRALRAITSMEHTAAPGQLREIARNALEEATIAALKFYAEEDAESVEDGILKSVFDRPATKTLAALVGEKGK